MQSNNIKKYSIYVSLWKCAYRKSINSKFVNVQHKYFFSFYSIVGQIKYTLFKYTIYQIGVYKM